MEQAPHVEESSELLSASSNRHAAPISAPSFDFHDRIVATGFYDLRVERRWPKDAPDDLLVEIESVGDDQGKTLVLHPVGNVAQESEGVPVASTSHHGRRPETRPDFDRDEDPTRLARTLPVPIQRVRNHALRALTIEKQGQATKLKSC